MSHLSRPEFLLYHLTPHLYNPKRLPAKALKKLNLPLRRCKFFSRMPSPASSRSSTLYNSSGQSSPGQHSSGYSSGSDMHVDSPPTALRAGIAPPRLSQFIHFLPFYLPNRDSGPVGPLIDTSAWHSHVITPMWRVFASLDFYIACYSTLSHAIYNARLIRISSLRVFK